MKAKDKLHLWWSKKKVDYLMNAPVGYGTTSDARLVMDVLTDERNPSVSIYDIPGKPVEMLPSLMDELDARGYDTTTVKFSIEPKKGNPKFRSQRDES